MWDIKCDIGYCEKEEKGFLYEEIMSNDLTFFRKTIDKFMNDKSFVCAEDCVVVLDGVLLNKKTLFEEYKCNAVSELCRKMYRMNGITFFEKFRGSFSGGDV